VVVGPWLSEVGFELLYWIPFVRYLFRKYEIAPQRVIVVSRGGVDGWYEGIATGYFDIFEEMSPESFLARNREREQCAGFKKQKKVSNLDKEVLARCVGKYGLKQWELVHPSWMYGLFHGFWAGMMNVKKVFACCDYRALGENWNLPEELKHLGKYVAVKMYFSDCLPDTEMTRSYVAKIIRSISERYPVVMLNAGVTVDDHRDMCAPEGCRVLDASVYMEPRKNLEIQTAIVANSVGLLCTYGGFSYLGPLLGKPTISFWSEQNFVTAHLQVAQEALNRWPRGFLTVMPIWGWESVCELIAGGESGGACKNGA
jgi:hypothetical protein